MNGSCDSLRNGWFDWGGGGGFREAHKPGSNVRVTFFFDKIETGGEKNFILFAGYLELHIYGCSPLQKRKYFCVFRHVITHSVLISISGRRKNLFSPKSRSWFWNSLKASIKRLENVNIWVKRPKPEADLSLLSSVTVKIAWSFASTPSHAFT